MSVGCQIVLCAENIWKKKDNEQTLINKQRTNANMKFYK